MMGLIVYLACDDEIKAKLLGEETEKRLNLKGDSDDLERVDIIKKIVTTISHEYSSERIQRETKFLNYIHQC